MPSLWSWHYDPALSHELGKLAVETGIWPLLESENGVLRLTGTTRSIAERCFKRKPVREYLSRQGRFAHCTEEDYEYFQKKVDQHWETWLIAGAVTYQIEDPKILNV